MMSTTMVGAPIEETFARVREQSGIVAAACSALAGSLRTRSVDEGLEAIERICATLLMAEELIEVIARAGAPGATLEEAHRLRERMVRRATPWIAAAVRDLPGAERVVRRFALAHRGAPRHGARPRGAQ